MVQISGKTHQLRRLVGFSQHLQVRNGWKILTIHKHTLPASSKEIHFTSKTWRWWCFFPNQNILGFPQKRCASQKSSLCYVFSSYCQPNKKKYLPGNSARKTVTFLGWFDAPMPLSKAATVSDLQLRGDEKVKNWLPGLRWQSRDLAAPLGPADQSKLGRVNEWSSFRNSWREWLTSEKK